MSVIGSARSDESRKYTGGQPGDQRQAEAPDFKGEVSRQLFYVHSKGWIILRPKNRRYAEQMAQAMAQMQRMKRF